MKYFTTNKLTRLVGAIGAALLTAGISSTALAQANWPDRPIKLIVAYPPGGPVDVSGRVFAKFLSEQLNQSVVVENRAGASGMIGADATAKAAPDGYTLNYVASPSLTISPIVQRSKLFDPRRDFTLISPIVQYANILLAGSQTNVKTVKELVDYARQNPDKVSFGSAGFGGSNHLSAELLKQSTNTQMLHVPYKGNVPATLKDEAGKGEIIVEVRAIEDTAPGEWLDPNKLRSVGKKNLLSAHSGGYVVAPNSYYEEVGTIALKPGAYWIKSTLTLPDGDYLDQVHVTHHQVP